jgi:hypothetical protein
MKNPISARLLWGFICLIVNLFPFKALRAFRDDTRGKAAYGGIDLP